MLNGLNLEYAMHYESTRATKLTKGLYPEYSDHNELKKVISKMVLLEIVLRTS